MYFKSQQLISNFREFDYDKIAVGHFVGQGAFGVIYWVDLDMENDSTNGSKSENESNISKNNNNINSNNNNMMNLITNTDNNNNNNNNNNNSNNSNTNNTNTDNTDTNTNAENTTNTTDTTATTGNDSTSKSSSNSGNTNSNANKKITRVAVKQLFLDRLEGDIEQMFSLFRKYYPSFLPSIYIHSFIHLPFLSSPHDWYDIIPISQQVPKLR